ncbi:hypothetical protein ALC57_16059 [Trachymyrmex cornetzi]|uniref:THAP9-like helix-turn-helix domain-containing protein n=1 Tax=Trachymyrmex cornetzi TaxID=471704 RepID=A0A151IVS8_9HYME|nr:hypothetical protein ALC57_16059 [Trachymyrmex cornetzi]
MLRVTIRRLRLEKKTKVKIKKDNEYKRLKELGHKLLPENFSRILMAQVDAQFKSKRGRRYDPELKKFALSLYFLSPRTYRELQKSIALSSVWSLNLFKIFNLFKKDDILYCSFRVCKNEEGNLFGNFFVKKFEKNCFQKNIGNYLLQLARNITFKPPCPNFPTTYLIKELFPPIRIYFRLSQHNKSCKKI